MKKILLFSLAFATTSIFAQKDAEASIFAKYSDACANSEVALCIPAYANALLGMPYVAKTLEKNDKEQLIINLQEFDCTTFVETVLAMAITAHSDNRSYETFQSTIQRLRYHQATIDGYASRIHYFSDWLYENEQNQVIRNMTRELGGIPYEKKINFMSTHPKAYKQLSDDKELKAIMIVEERMNEREQFYIPKEQVKGIEEMLQDGDIIAITTKVEGLDVAHEGIIVKKDNQAYLLHASSDLKEVVLSKESLSAYIDKHPTQTGIMVARAN